MTVLIPAALRFVLPAAADVRFRTLAPLSRAQGDAADAAITWAPGESAATRATIGWVRAWTHDDMTHTVTLWGDFATILARGRWVITHTFVQHPPTVARNRTPDRRSYRRERLIAPRAELFLAEVRVNLAERETARGVWVVSWLPQSAAAIAAMQA